jgi:hypothetical protein
VQVVVMAARKSGSTMIPLGHSVSEAASLASLSVRKMNDLIAGHDPKLTSIRIGRRRIILHEDLVEYLRSLRSPRP